MNPPNGAPPGPNPLTAICPVRTRRAIGEPTVDVGAPHRAGQPVLRVVRDPDRVVVVVIAQHRQHRPEYLFLGDGGVRRDLGEDRRLEVVATVQTGRPTAAGRQLGAVIERPIYVCLNAFALCGADQWAHLHVGIGGVADLHRPGHRDQPIDHLVVDRVGQQHPAVQNAGLPGVK